MTWKFGPASIHKKSDQFNFFKADILTAFFQIR